LLVVCPSFLTVGDGKLLYIEKSQTFQVGNRLEPMLSMMAILITLLLPYEICRFGNVTVDKRLTVEPIPETHSGKP
jgi:hypothetical protein